MPANALRACIVAAIFGILGGLLLPMYLVPFLPVVGCLASIIWIVVFRPRF